MARYRAGDLDMTNYALPPEQFAKLQKELPGEVFTTRTLATYSYELNNKKAPFDNVNVRKALNLSLDRNVITDKVLGQGQTPTYVLRRLTSKKASSFNNLLIQKNRWHNVMKKPLNS